MIVPAIILYMPSMFMGTKLFHSNVYAKFFLTMNLGIFLALFYITYVSPIVMSKAGCAVRGDFLQPVTE